MFSKSTCILLSLLPAFCAAGTFQQQWEAALAALRQQDWIAADAQLDHIESIFGREKLFLEPVFHQNYLRLRSWARFQCGRHEAGLQDYYQAFANIAPKDIPPQLILACIRSLQQQQLWDKAYQNLATFIQHHPQHPWHDWALYSRAEAWISTQLSSETASAHWFELATSDLFRDNAWQARAMRKAAATALATNNWPHLQQILESIQPDLMDTPYAAFWTTILLAFQQHCLQTDNAATAIHYARWLPDESNMQLTLQKQIQQLRQKIQSLRNWKGPAAEAWEISAQWTLAEWQAYDQQRPIYPQKHALWSRLIAFLQHDRPREALAVIQPLQSLPSQTFDPGELSFIAEQQIRCLQKLKDYEQAEHCIQNFMRSHPESPHLPNFHFLQACGWLENNNSSRGTEALLQLIQNHPAHPRAHAWRIRLAGHYREQGSFDEAIDIFASCHQLDPDSITARHALILAAETARIAAKWQRIHQLVEPLLQLRSGGFHALALHLKIQAYHGAADDTSVIRFSDTALASYAHHALSPQWSFWKAQALTTQLQFAPALQIFQQLCNPAEPLSHKALLETARIRRLQNDPVSAVNVISSYIRQHLPPPDPDLCEVLQLLTRLSEASLCSQLMDTLLEQWGNVVQADGVETLIYMRYALQRKTQQKLSPDEWLRAATNAAWEKQHLIHWSRFVLAQADNEATRKRESHEEMSVLQLVRHLDLPQMSPAVLLRIGRLYWEAQLPSADDYLNYILDKHPNSIQEPEARILLALMAENKDSEVARKQASYVLKNWPASTAAWQSKILLSRIYLNEQNPDKAIENCRDVLNTKSAGSRLQAEALWLWGKAAYSRKMPGDAISCWQRLTTLYPGEFEFSSNAFLHTGILFIETGDLSAALQTWNEALRFRKHLPPHTVQEIENQITKHQEHEA